MRYLLLAFAACLTTPAGALDPAGPPVDATDTAATDLETGEVVELNGRIQQQLDAVAAQNAQAQARYAAEMATFEARKREVDKEVAAANAAKQAYDASLVAYQARWGSSAAAAPVPGSARTARQGATARADARPSPSDITVKAKGSAKRVCTTGVATGSLVQKVRTCTTGVERNKRMQEERDTARDFINSGHSPCIGISCG